MSTDNTANMPTAGGVTFVQWANEADMLAFQWHSHRLTDLQLFTPPTWSAMEYPHALWEAGVPAREAVSQMVAMKEQFNNLCASFGTSHPTRDVNTPLPEHGWKPVKAVTDGVELATSGEPAVTKDGTMFMVRANGPKDLLGVESFAVAGVICEVPASRAGLKTDGFAYCIYGVATTFDNGVPTGWVQTGSTGDQAGPEFFGERWRRYEGWATGGYQTALKQAGYNLTGRVQLEAGTVSVAQQISQAQVGARFTLPVNQIPTFNSSPPQMPIGRPLHM